MAYYLREISSATPTQCRSFYKHNNLWFSFLLTYIQEVSISGISSTNLVIVVSTGKKSPFMRRMYSKDRYFTIYTNMI
ncbi:MULTISPECIES: hypothetical protein [Chryseobacterium]|uniref:Uncharacterized protein n=1 Tax=Chryseobacterium geocarposphaerae TaxID=1416776 RepID=A0ABU1L959_9FLAO|nr:MULTISPECIES: hypothetical protein [Chryseobacterium]MDR6403247.1 hypothetical protein [Chryseobacterium geocarposphaerae]MDR6696801.1 hypothetical protein [Chryseobacterium ginsenosidimutans]